MFLKKVALMALIFLNTSVTMRTKTEAHNSIWLPEVTVTASPINKTIEKKGRVKTFLGFIVCGASVSYACDKLVAALEDYEGPKPRITSLFRPHCHKSAHSKGKAVDLEFCDEAICYLMSEEGQQWIEKHDLLLYIEARPKDKILKPYKENALTSEYVFENPHASGPHLHISVK